MAGSTPTSPDARPARRRARAARTAAARSAAGDADGPPGTREQCKEIMRKLIDEVWAKGDLDLADELFHSEAICPSAPTLPVGPEGTKMIVQMVRDGFPDYWVRIDPDRRRGRPRRRPDHAGRHAHRRVLRDPADRQDRFEWTEMAILADRRRERSSRRGSTATSRG